MFGMIESLTKAVVGVVVEAPVAIAVDVVTLGQAGATSDALSNVVDNLQDATKPSSD